MKLLFVLLQLEISSCMWISMKQMRMRFANCAALVAVLFTAVLQLKI